MKLQIDHAPVRLDKLKAITAQGNTPALPGLVSLRGGQVGQPGGGVQVASIITDQTAGPVVYDPTHPDADAKGFVTMPNVNVTEEIVDMVTATRSYEANIAAVDAAKTMIRKALEIVR